MKHLYTIIAILSFGITIAQVPAVDFEANGADYISPSSGNSGNVTIVDDAVDAATYGKVANIVNPAEQYDAWLIKLDNKISFARHFVKPLRFSGLIDCRFDKIRYRYTGNFHMNATCWLEVIFLKNLRFPKHI